MTNYLWRPILPALCATVAPDGLLICETFARGHEALGRPTNPDFLLIGDFNSYEMEAPITTLEGAGYTNLVAAFNPGLNYSYGFPNNTNADPEVQTWGTLDYAFASASLVAQVVGAAEWWRIP